MRVEQIASQPEKTLIFGAVFIIDFYMLHHWYIHVNCSDKFYLVVYFISYFFLILGAVKLPGAWLMDMKMKI